MTPKKKFAYILVNGLIANFEFQSFWAKKVEFFCHGAPILPLSVLKFFWRVSNSLKAKWLKLEKNWLLHAEVNFS